MSLEQVLFILLSLLTLITVFYYGVWPAKRFAPPAPPPKLDEQTVKALNLKSARGAAEGS
jgi:hypothetical protein